MNIGCIGFTLVNTPVSIENIFKSNGYVDQIIETDFPDLIFLNKIAFFRSRNILKNSKPKHFDASLF